MTEPFSFVPVRLNALPSARTRVTVFILSHGKRKPFAWTAAGLACALCLFTACNPRSTSTRPSIERSSDGSGGPDSQASPAAAKVGTGITALAFSPDGTMLIAADQTGSIRLLDSATGAERSVLGTHSSWIHRVVFSSDGKSLASGSEDKSVRVVDPKTGAEKALFKGLDGRAMSVTFSKDNKRVAASLKLYDLTDLEDVKPDGKRVHKRPAGPFGRVIVLDIDQHKQVSRTDLDEEPTDLAYSPDGSMLAVGTREGTILLLDPDSGNKRSTLSGPAEVQQFVFSKDGKNVFAAAGAMAYGWQTTGAKLFSYNNPGSNNFIAVDVSPDGALVAVANSFGKAVVVLRATTGEVVTTIPHDPMPLAVAFSPDGKSLASGSAKGKLSFWDPATGRQLR